jgi:hypothetical protein
MDTDTDAQLRWLGSLGPRRIGDDARGAGTVRFGSTPLLI